MIAALISEFRWPIAVLLALALAGVQTLRLGTAQAERDAAQARADAAQQLERSTAAAWELRGLELQSALGRCQQQWADLQQSSAQAVQRAQAARLEAEAALTQYLARWQARSAHCGALLIDAERGCAELEGY